MAKRVARARLLGSLTKVFSLFTLSVCDLFRVKRDLCGSPHLNDESYLVLVSLVTISVSVSRGRVHREDHF